MSNESNRRPMGLRARADRWSSKVVGGLTILVALALIAKLSFGPAVGGVFILYGGLLLFPMTRRKASFGVFGFTKEAPGRCSPMNSISIWFEFAVP